MTGRWEGERQASDMRMLLLRDWRQALRTPHVYRVGNSTLRVQHQLIAVLFLVVVLPLVFYAYPWFLGTVCTGPDGTPVVGEAARLRRYNSTYPITAPVKSGSGVSYRIGIISDLDKDSRDSNGKNAWYSVLRRGQLFWSPGRNAISVTWDQDHVRLVSTLAMNGRGMELSELVTFDGRLLTFDDRTGIVYYLDGDQAFPWLILMDGSGRNTKG